VTEPAPALIPTLTVGRPAPDFLVKDLTTNESTNLRRWLGKPILMVFYSPDSYTAGELLHFAQSLHVTYPEDLHVLGLAVADDSARVLKQRGDLRLTIPVLAGTGLRLSYGVESTPKLVVIDGAGLTRASVVGWGPETAATVKQELLRCLNKGAPPGKSRP
jgi:peroxiredoxin